MKFYKIALLDVVSSHREIVLIKDKQYLLLADESSRQYYFHGENGRAYLLQDHPEWFRDDSANIMMMSLPGFSTIFLPGSWEDGN